MDRLEKELLVTSSKEKFIIGKEMEHTRDLAFIEKKYKPTNKEPLGEINRPAN